MIRFLAPLLLALSLAAPAAAQTRALSDFTSVSARGGYRVEVTQGEGYSVRVVGSDANRILTNLQGGRLEISPRRRSWFSFGGLDAVVQVRMPRVDALGAAQGARLRADGLRSDDLRLSVAQGGSLQARDIQAGSVSLAVAQGGVLSASGVCGSVRASASQGGDIDAGGLVCENGEADVSMGGNVNLHVTGILDASTSMGGNVNVRGGARLRNSSTSMGGDINID